MHSVFGLRLSWKMSECAPKDRGVAVASVFWLTLTVLREFLNSYLTWNCLMNPTNPLVGGFVPHPLNPRNGAFHRAARETGRLSRFCLCAALLLAALLPSTPSRAATLPTGFIESDILGYWPEVAGLTFDSTGVMYVWERAGRVWIVENDVKLSTPLLDISQEVGAYDDYGLLGVALDPNFRQNGYIYLLYVVDHHYLANFGTAN